MFISPFDNRSQDVSGLAALFGISGSASSRDAASQDVLSGGDTVSISDEARNLADEYRAALGMDSNGKFNLNHSDTSGELTEAIQEELESLTQKLAELTSVQPQTEEVRQKIRIERSHFEKGETRGGGTAR